MDAKPFIVYYPKGIDEDTADNLWTTGNHAIQDRRTTPAPQTRPRTPPSISNSATKGLEEVIPGENWRGTRGSPTRHHRITLSSNVDGRLTNNELDDDDDDDDDDRWEEKYNSYRQFQLVEIRLVVHQGHLEIWRHTRCDDLNGKRIEAMTRSRFSGRGTKIETVMSLLE